MMDELALTKKHLIKVNKFYFIWFSADPEIFLPVHNVMRLVRFRKKNPELELSLIYYERSLTKKTQERLKEFCCEFNISLIKFTDIKSRLDELYEDKHSENYKLDLDLYVLAQNEVLKALKHKGGNLAVASDLIRVLKLKLGIYCDIDVLDYISNIIEKEIIASASVIVNGLVDLQYYGGNIIKKGQKVSNDVIAIAEGADEAEWWLSLKQKLRKNFLVDKINKNIKELLEQINIFVASEQSSFGDIPFSLSKLFFKKHGSKLTIWDYKLYIESLSIIDYFLILNADLETNILNMLALKGEKATKKEVHCVLGASIREGGATKSENLCLSDEALSEKEFLCMKNQYLMHIVLYITGPNLFVRHMNSSLDEELASAKSTELGLTKARSIIENNYKHLIFNSEMKHLFHTPSMEHASDMSWTLLSQEHTKKNNFLMNKMFASFKNRQKKEALDKLSKPYVIIEGGENLCDQEKKHSLML